MSHECARTRDNQLLRTVRRRILRHLDRPATAPVVARVRSAGEAKGFELLAEDRGAGRGACENDVGTGNGPERGPLG